MSIIIPAINEVAVIEQAVERAKLAGGDEIIVVDGGSDDRTVEVAQRSGARVFHHCPGRGEQLNRGAAAATGDVLLFLHADNWLVDSGCDQIRNCPPPRNRLWGGFRQMIGDNRFKYRVLAQGNQLRVRWQGLVYGDQAMFVSRSLLQSVGGFPEQALMEDFEISRRLMGKHRPLLLDGPTHVSDRRWKQRGVIRQTISNWSLATRYRLGESPAKLAEIYCRHDSINRQE